jgi:sterol desaturase/sphingolipid hydroxylase (fatty acid hydroxylase superfamily)
MNALEVLATVIGGLMILVFLSFLLSWPVYMLWNGCLVGAIDGVHAVTWEQAWGLSLLCGFLFKSTTSKK